VLADLGIETNPDLTKILTIAAHVGDLGGDEVDVSYTSLLIGFLWSDDPTSLWLQAQAQKFGVRLDEIYSLRNHIDRHRATIMERVATQVDYKRHTDAISISARTVLQEAQTLANEVRGPSDDPIGARHVAAVYFFRNPPGHDRQLHVEWGFDTETWRRAFAAFIQQQFPDEAGKWAQTLNGYLPRNQEEPSIPGSVLAAYEFDSPAIRLLHTLRNVTLHADSTTLTSEQLLRTLAAVQGDPDCTSLAELVAKRLKIEHAMRLVDNETALGAGKIAYSTSRGLKNVLDRARLLSRSTTGSVRIGIRHIVASILVAPDSTANRRLVRVGVSVPLLRQKLLREFTRRWVNDDGIQWRFHLVGQAPPTVASFNADQADSGEDKLDVARYATAFAMVLAAEKVTPPLSVGVFGDWGSGKSFFMRLMQEQTKRVAASSATDANGDRLFCRQIVSIPFNAWHYAGGNLWASLVQTIFQSLRAAMVGNRDDSDLMDRVIAKLEVTKVARKAAEERVTESKKVEVDSRQKLEQKKEAWAAKALEVETVKTKDVVSVLRKTVFKDLHLDDAATLAEKYLGITNVRTVVENQQRTTGEVIDAVNETRIVAARSRPALEWLARAPVKGYEISALVIVCLLIISLGFFLAIRYHAQINAAWPLVSAAFIQGGAAVALVTAWARRHLATVSKGLDQFDSVRVELDRRVTEQRQVGQQGVVAAEAALRQAAENVAAAEAALAAAQEAVLRAEREVVESRSANRIAQLVEQRITGKQYEQYLGIVDAIRRDFQSLTDLMKQLRKEKPPPEPDGVLPIDRIVLYIDDLDRCPSDKVVSVLEAIHLLLAFELFVVVVGVDVRWAARSLAERYPSQLSTGTYEGTARDHLASGASALDYLEKIFQIPFWLPPMDDQASRNMIAELVPRPKAATGDQPVQQGAVEKPPAGDGAGDEKKALNSTAPPEPEVATTAQSSPVEPMSIESEERSFMLSLAEAVGKSPRRLKRFVNTYRILKGSIDALGRETFVLDSGRSGDYRGAMTLLALVTGAPQTSLALLQVLADGSDDDSLETVLEKVGGRAVREEERKYVDAALQAYKATTGGKATVRDLRQWMPQVTRFSFRSGSW